MRNEPKILRAKPLRARRLEAALGLARLSAVSTLGRRTSGRRELKINKKYYERSHYSIENKGSRGETNLTMKMRDVGAPLVGGQGGHEGRPYVGYFHGITLEHRRVECGGRASS